MCDGILDRVADAIEEQNNMTSEVIRLESKKKDLCMAVDSRIKVLKKYWEDDCVQQQIVEDHNQTETKEENEA